MQSNGSAVQSTVAKTPEQEPPIVKERKKVPPKPPKRVSFDLKYRQNVQKPSNANSDLIINGTKRNIARANSLNGGFLNNNYIQVEVNKSNTSAELNLSDALRKIVNEPIDKICDKPTSPSKANSNICDTGQVDNDIRNNKRDETNVIKEKRETTTERLRSEFVKSNEGPSKPWPAANQSVPVPNASPKSPNSNIQSRLSESQSKIAKLQQSLPTKLSDAAVESLKSRNKSFDDGIQSRLSESQSKIAKLQQSLPAKLSDATVASLKSKYSPASFGYPKYFAKPPNESSKIPTKSVTQSKTNTVAHEENKQVFSNDKKTEESDVSSPKKIVAVERKRTFRTELYILPNETNQVEEQLELQNKSIDVVDAVSTVQAKLISSEIFPKDVTPEKNVTHQVVEEPKAKYVELEETDDPSEQSSDTLTESGDSQILNSPSVSSEREVSSPKSTETVKNIEETDNNSYTSEVTYCEVFEEESQDMEDQKKKPQKKRSNSFRKIFSFGSSKDKKKNEDAKPTKSNTNGFKKKDNMLSDNAQNEAHMFDRNASQRHTVGGHYSSRDWERKIASTKENVPFEPFYTNADRYRSPNPPEPYSGNFDNNRVTNLPVATSRQPCSPANIQGPRIEDRLNKIQLDIYLAQQTKSQLNANLTINSRQCTMDEYVCMDNNDVLNRTDLTQPGFVNAQFIDKYIDTTSSSSISTMESDTRNIIYENTVKSSNRPAKVQNTTVIPSSSNSRIESPIGEKFYERPKFADSPEIFTTTPRRTQGPQLIKPKAIIPINTERALPNPYRNIKEGEQIKSPDIINREHVYGYLKPPDNLNDIAKINKDAAYGKPVARRNIPVTDLRNSPRNDINIKDDIYGTVYDSLVPVGAQLKITKAPIINGGKTENEKRSRSVSPSQRHRAVNLASSQSFSYKSRPPPLPKAPTSPSRKEVEGTKLRLPGNREVLEPRLKSPVDERRNPMTRIKSPIDVAKKNVDPVKKDNKNHSSTHQNLEIEIDYPENNINEMQERKDTPEKYMFSSTDNDTNPKTEPVSPKRPASIKRSAHVSPNRPKSFTHSTPKNKQSEPFMGNAQVMALRSPTLNRADSPASITSSHSLSSLSSKTKLPVKADLKDLKNTEVYFWEQSQEKQQNIKIEDNSPDQSPQQVLTHATVHQPHVSPRKSDSLPSHTLANQKPLQTNVPVSPQKVQTRQNVEAFYWQQIKKLKEKEEHEYYNQHLQMLARQNVEPKAQQHRSRSMTVGPSPQRERRSVSLPRDAVPPANTQKLNNELYGYTRTGRQEPIPEGRIIVAPRMSRERVQADYGMVRHPMQTQNFVRGSPQRNTVGAINIQKQSPSAEMIYENYFPGVELRHQSKTSSNGYAPIFKRGSLQRQQESVQQDSPPNSNKKVSFSSAQSDEGQVWPTKNGFTQSPPTRRVDKRVESMDDEVFLPATPTSNSKQAPIQYNQVLAGYNAMKEPVYVSNKLPPTHPNTNQQYASKAPLREPIYGRTGKQVTVTNRVCDMYGQIHEQQASKLYGNIQKTGVIYGQLQANPMPGSPASMRNQPLNRSDPSFVRGTRLTSSYNDMHSDTSRRPLPPIPSGSDLYMQKIYGRFNPVAVSESESGSEAGEVQRILGERRRLAEEEWNSDSKTGRNQSDSGGGRGSGDNDGEVRGSRSARSGRRDDPRRHTLSGDQHYPAGMAQQGGPLSRTMDLEVPMPRGYPPPSSAMLFDDDPGIMSEVETSSTGFRRGGKQRSSLPVVRTPSKTLERPLGLVFLQYRNETKRALLPNEITSIDTVKALFVRSFPKQLTMEYLDSPLVKIYIHDSSKDMFYELEDLRSHLRDIRDRSVLRLFESADISGGLPGPGTGISGGVGHFEDQSYFSEPEFDSEYQHQHIHKSKTSGAKGAPPYYMGSTTLPRGGPLLRAYSPAIGGPIPADRLKTLPTGAPPKPLRTYTSGGSGAAPGGRGPGLLSRAPERFNTFHSQADLRHRSDNPLFSMPDRIHTDGYMSSPERGSRAQYEDPYYSQYAARSGSITPVIDEEASDTELLDESYSLYGVKLPPPGGPRAVPAPRTQFPPAPTAVPYDATRIRVENMERQLANLTGLVQKALHQTPPSTREFLQVPGGRESYRTGDEFDKNSSSSSASLPDKSVSFEKSVSFSDEPPDMNSPKQHSPQHTADTKPPKPAIKSSTLPRTSSQERDRLKPAPPPKPASLSPAQYDNSRNIYRDLQLTPEMYNQLRGLQKKAKDLRTEVRNLRRLSQAQAHSVRETIRDTFIKIRAMLLASGEQVWQAGIDQEKLRLSREEDLYKQEMIRLEKDLTELESTVEELRGNVINRKTRVNMSDVENMALILSKSSKTVADLKLRFPGLQDAMKNLLSSEMEKVVREEKFLKEEPERLETALRRCKKLTGTLVTLKRLASVQEQRLPGTNSDGRLSPTLSETPPITPPSAQHSKPPAVPPTRSVLGQGSVGGDSGGGNSSDSSQRPENALDALLDELQTFSKPHPVSTAPSTVTTQLPQAASYMAKIASNTTPSMAEIGRKGSMDSATLLPVQNLTVSTATGSLRRLHSYPSGSDTDNSPPIQPLQRMDSRSVNKPPIPERNAELLQHLASGRRVPPPPPPRTSSKSPLASPTSPSLPPRSIPNQNPLQHIQNVQNMTSEKPQSQFEAATQNLGLGTLRRNVPGRSSLKEKSQTLPRNTGSNLQVQVIQDGLLENKVNAMSTSNSSSCESVNSQEGAKKGNRKEELEQRHQELLKKQKALQEQYARLQQLQRGNNTLTVVPPAPDLLLKKTGSESNLLQKMGLQMTAPQQMTGSLTHLANASLSTVQQQNLLTSIDTNVNTNQNNNTTTNKVYETDIL